MGTSVADSVGAGDGVTVAFGTAVAVIVSVASVIPSLRRAAPQWRTTQYLLAADRGVTLSLVIFLLLMMFLLKGYPVRLNRNVILLDT